ncbi:MAG: helix-turn-helix transcriptional regulator [Lachnospiraceae bacterium]|nr:helix-turn-helix transcriptional regulator [Lachnospiraceae bacterium]
MEIGSKLKNARKEKGITQEHAAELLDVSRQTISNWENNKSYPDIISVIKMSDIYSVSLDHLLKEEKSMKQTYQEFLEESTNTVKAKRNLGEIILISTYFIIWVVAMIAVWQTRGPMTAGLDIIFKWILLPLFLLVSTVIVAKNDYWGKGNWFCIIAAAITFLTVPYTEFVEEMGTATFTFRFPNFTYMVVGVIVSICGIGIGNLWRKKNFSKEKSKNNV